MSDEDEDMEDEDLDDEDGDEDEYDDDDDGGSRADHAFLFDEETQGIIVAGKSFELSGMSRKDLGAFAAHVKAIAEKTSLPITVVPSGDMSADSGPGPDDNAYCSLHVGFVSGWGGTDQPDGISREQALEALKNAQNVSEDLWKEIGDKLDEKQRERYDEAEVGLHLTCVGPLTAATLAFGVVGEEDGEGPGEYIVGQNMGQEQHEEGVWGVNVAYVQYESPESEEIDLSDEAHEKRVKELGVDGGAYYLVARYD